MSISSDQAEHPWNCLNCKRRKVRCDRHTPCSNCEKGQRECVFPTAGRIFRRAERPPGSTHTGSRQTELTNRIRRLERVVETLNSELESHESRADSRSGATAQASYQGVPGGASNFRVAAPSRPDGGAHLRQSSESQARSRNSTIMVSEDRGSIYIGDRFWASLRQEIKLVRESFDDLQDQGSDLDSSYAPTLLLSHRNSSINNSSFVFRLRSNEQAANSLDDLRPLPSQMLFIWQVYVERVGNFVKVVHVPTLTKIIQSCSGQIETLGPSMEPLMFAISLAAINSLNEEEVRLNFHRNKEDLVAQLRLGTERALARADFVTTTSLSVLQAAVIHIFVILKEESSRYTWSMVGLLGRIAISMGLHRDGSHFPNMSPLEIELRRRIWWFVCFLEPRCWHGLGNSGVTGVGISEKNFDTHDPLNINDEDINAEMTELPPPRTGVTESTLTLMRCDLWRIFQTMKSLISKIGTASQKASEEKIERMLGSLRKFTEISSQRFEAEPDSPITVMLGYICRFHANNLALLAQHFRQPSSQSDGPDDKTFTLAVCVIEDFHEFMYGERTKRMAWLVQGQVHWQPIAVVISRIGLRPWDSSAENLWKMVTRLLGDVSEAVQADPLWQPLRQLITRASRHRSQQLALQGQSPESPLSVSAQSPPATGHRPNLTAPSGKCEVAIPTPPGMPMCIDDPAGDIGSVCKDMRNMQTIETGPTGHAQQQDEWMASQRVFPAVENERPETWNNLAMADNSFEAIGWESWNDMLRTDGQSLLWGLGAI